MAKNGPIRTVENVSTLSGRKGSTAGSRTRGPVRTAEAASRTPGVGGDQGRRNSKNGSQRGVRSTPTSTSL